MDFKTWMRRVDGELAATCGLASQDLADQTYYDWFEDGYTPHSAVMETLENEGFPF